MLLSGIKVRVMKTEPPSITALITASITAIELFDKSRLIIVKYFFTPYDFQFFEYIKLAPE